MLVRSDCDPEYEVNKLSRQISFSPCIMAYLQVPRSVVDARDIYLGGYYHIATGRLQYPRVNENFPYRYRQMNGIFISLHNLQYAIPYTLE